MLYVFCGDRFSSRNYAGSFADACRKKRTQAEYIYLSPGFPHHSLEELLFGQGLFEKKYIVFCDEMLGDTLSGHLTENLGAYQSSPHMFIIFEPALTAAQEKSFTECGASIKRFREQVAAEDSRALFAFTDVFVRRDRGKTLAALYRLLQKGESPTSLLNILLWQLRMLVLVSRSENAVAAGVKPFVFTKAKKALTSFASPFGFFLLAEQAVRRGRLHGASDEEIIEYIILG